MMSKLFVFEGADCVGKTTALFKVSRELYSRGIVHRVRSIWDNELGGILKVVVLDPTVPNMAKGLIIAGVRYTYYVEHVKPLIDNGVIVLMDRWTLSTMAYQGGVTSRPSDYDISMLHVSIFSTLGNGYDITFPPTCFVTADRGVVEDRLKKKHLPDYLESSTEIQDKVWEFYSHHPSFARGTKDVQVCGMGELDVKSLVDSWLLPQIKPGSICESVTDE